jgi:hypothetical protein
MQPRGQLWFELQRVCDDFRAFSGLEAEEATKILVVVLRNLLAEEETALGKLSAAGNSPAPQPSPIQGEGASGFPPPG